jgi:gluconolactonase
MTQASRLAAAARSFRVALGLLFTAGACSSVHAQPPAADPTIIGKVTRYDAALDAVIAADARVEKLAEGFTWAEGPVWIRSSNYLLFTDVPENKMYRWSQSDGSSVFLDPSGLAGPIPPGVREAGANGLHVDGENSVLLADSGSRVVARLNLKTKHKQVLAESYQGKRFNSPNDLARKRDGTVFFTDPPYGLENGNESPLKELKSNGVYRLSRDGTVTLIDDSLSFPNGIALSPDERILYVANSDPLNPIWMRYELDEKGDVLDKRVFADASDLMKNGVPGLPDGISVAATGHLFATGPGGVLILSPEGKRLGRIETGSAIANCTFGDEGRTLYMTSHKLLARVHVLVAGSPLER